MSDISIPGVTSRFDTDKMIQELMKLERIPLDRMKESVETYKTEKKTWQTVNRRIAQFRDSARVLFGFENPFRDRMVTSSRDNIITGVAERGIQEESRSIAVQQLAKTDRFLSSSVKTDYRVSEGTYSFRVGEETVSFSYAGGSLESFAQKLADRGEGLINARVVNDTADTQVLLIEGLKTGSENRLLFEDDSIELGLQTGMLAKSIDTHFTFNLSRTGVSPLTNAVEDALFSGEEQTLRFIPESDARLPITNDISSQTGLELNIRYRIENSEDAYTPPTPPPGPSVAPPGIINVEDVTVENEPSNALTPPWAPPEPPKKVTDLQVFSLWNQGRSANLPPIQGENGTYTMRVPLAEYMQAPRALDIRNKNTHKTVIIEEAAIYDPNARGEYKPANPIDQAQDAIIALDGIRINRSGNTIDDVIPGLTLNLHGTSEEPVQIDVEPDRKNIKTGIINFVGYYNQLLTDIHVLTREDSSIIENLEYLSEEEVKEYEEKLGLFQGDITLNQLRSKLQQIMMEAYPAEKNGDLVLLAQIGISTNASGTGTGIEASRLRGYLEIDESTLDQALETKINQVQNLFGRDTDGDMVMDSGVAVVTDRYIQPYSQSGGIIALKMRTIDQQIERTNDDIENLSDRLNRKEAQLERDYGQMEGALESMEETSRAIGNLNNSNQD